MCELQLNTKFFLLVKDGGGVWVDCLLGKILQARPGTFVSSMFILAGDIRASDL